MDRELFRPAVFVRLLRDGTRRVHRRWRAVMPPEPPPRRRTTPADPAAPPKPVMVGRSCVRPFEDESSADFTERVARIKADLLSRALTAPEELRAARAAAAARASAARAAAAAESDDRGSPEEGRLPWSVAPRGTPSPAAADTQKSAPARRSGIARPTSPARGTTSAPTERRPPDDPGAVLDRVFGA